MFEYLAGKDAVERSVVKGEGFAVIVYIDLFVLMIVAAHFNVGADILRDLK